MWYDSVWNREWWRREPRVGISREMSPWDHVTHMSGLSNSISRLAPESVMLSVCSIWPTGIWPKCAGNCMSVLCHGIFSLYIYGIHCQTFSEIEITAFSLKYHWNLLLWSMLSLGHSELNHTGMCKQRGSLLHDIPYSIYARTQAEYKSNIKLKNKPYTFCLVCLFWGFMRKLHVHWKQKSANLTILPSLVAP